MGLDAPSTDLTHRIQQTRKRLILSGDIEPMRPGERMIHGRAPGSSSVMDIDAVSRAADMRERRSSTVVEMDLTDYTGTQPGTKELAEAADADEAFEVGDTTEPVADEAGFDLGPEGARVDAEPEEVFEPEETYPEERTEVDAAYAETILGEFAEVRERLDELGAALVQVAVEVGSQLREILDRLDREPVKVYSAERELADDETDLAEELRAAFARPIETPPSKWRAFLSTVFSGGSGPYE